MLLVAYIVLMVMCIMMAVNPQKVIQKSITKQETKNGSPFSQEELDKKYKNARIMGIILAIVFTIIMFI